MRIARHIWYSKQETGWRALTAGSLHDRIVKQWGYIRSYVMKDGHLFLSLMADGGIYEFEPIISTNPPPPLPR